MLFICECCLSSDIDLNNVVQCLNGHISCIECISRNMEIAITEHRIMKCVECDSEYVDTILKLLDDKMQKSYNIIQIESELRKELRKELELSLKKEIEDSVRKEMLMKYGWRNYIQEILQKILPQYCDCEKNKEKKIHDEEERATEEVILRCECGLAMQREFGCNHIICPTCKKHWCWLCKLQFEDKQEIMKHYRNNNKYNQCRLNGERIIGKNKAGILQYFF